MYNLILDDAISDDDDNICHSLLFRISLVFWIGEVETKTRHFQQMMMSKCFCKMFMFMIFSLLANFEPWGMEHEEQ